MKERVLKTYEKEYKNMVAVAKMLEATSKGGYDYNVQDVYLDFGQNWVWTTICRRGGRECQILSPRQWKLIVSAETVGDIVEAVEDIKADKYFED